MSFTSIKINILVNLKGSLVQTYVLSFENVYLVWWATTEKSMLYKIELFNAFYASNT